VFSEISARLSLCSELAAAFMLQHRITALEGLIDQNDVVSDALDAFPRNVVFFSPAEQSKKFARTINNDGTDLSVRQPDLHIRNKAKAAPIADIDNFFATHIPYSAVHPHPLPQNSMQAAECPIHCSFPSFGEIRQYRKTSGCSY